MRRQLQINAPLTLKKKTTKGAHPRIVAHKFSGTSCLGTSCLGDAAPQLSQRKHGVQLNKKVFFCLLHVFLQAPYGRFL